MNLPTASGRVTRVVFEGCVAGSLQAFNSMCLGSKRSVTLVSSVVVKGGGGKYGGVGEKEGEEEGWGEEV